MMPICVKECTQIQQLLDARLLRNGITPLDPLKKQFNPAEHEAIAHITF